MDRPVSRTWTIIASAPSRAIRFGDQRLDTDVVQIIPRVSGAVWLATESDGSWSPPARYDGSVTVTLGRNDRLMVINEVDVESYVPCVVAREAGPAFHREAVRALAIVVRTYVLYQMKNRRTLPYDVSAGEASQVYSGRLGGESAKDAWSAAEHTRGVVCTTDENGRRTLFPTYHSAVCGGVTQSASVFDRVEPVAPLRGGVACDYCQIAPAGTYRWEPVSLSAAELVGRLRDRVPGMEDFRRLVGVEVTTRHASGRPIRLCLFDSMGSKHQMQAETFRRIVGGSVMRSADCTIAVENGRVRLSRGKGFGHGVGLCQWGAQGQALSGRKAGEILWYYYPGAKLERAY